MKLSINWDGRNEKGSIPVSRQSMQSCTLTYSGLKWGNLRWLWIFWVRGPQLFHPWYPPQRQWREKGGGGITLKHSAVNVCLSYFNVTFSSKYMLIIFLCVSDSVYPKYAKSEKGNKPVYS